MCVVVGALVAVGVFPLGVCCHVQSGARPATRSRRSLEPRKVAQAVEKKQGPAAGDMVTPLPVELLEPLGNA